MTRNARADHPNPKEKIRSNSLSLWQSANRRRGHRMRRRATLGCVCIEIFSVFLHYLRTLLFRSDSCCSVCSCCVNACLHVYMCGWLCMFSSVVCVFFLFIGESTFKYVPGRLNIVGILSCSSVERNIISIYT